MRGSYPLSNKNGFAIFLWVVVVGLNGGLMVIFCLVCDFLALVLKATTTKNTLDAKSSYLFTPLNAEVTKHLLE